jgi:hypothetical protein
MAAPFNASCLTASIVDFLMPIHNEQRFGYQLLRGFPNDEPIPVPAVSGKN